MSKIELVCKVQNYDWGKTGRSSLVANLANPETTVIEEHLPYAELWMGTHVNGPSVVKDTGAPLLKVIKENPEFIGKPVVEKFGADLPFLFKVLSVRKALSIQAHPGKEHAEELHEKFPDIYKDPNHKPELAIALTPFEALCGFRTINEIRDFVKTVPELNNIVGNDILQIPEDQAFLKAAFKAVLTSSQNIINEQLSKLIARIASLDEHERNSEMAPLIERLNNEYPNDVGIFMVYFLNYIKMKPSEAIFLGANKPHAYLSGDCVECMACSDNVVRAGLTPKFIDVDTLTSMLIYEGEKPSEILFEPIIEDKCTKLYKPPVPDFAVAQIQIPNDIKTYETIPRSSASILIVIHGAGNTEDDSSLEPGKILFIPAEKSITINVVDNLVMYQAFANL